MRPLGQKIDIDAGAQEPLVGQSVVGAGVDDHPPALVAEVEIGAALPGGALAARPGSEAGVSSPESAGKGRLGRAIQNRLNTMVKMHSA